VKAQRDDGKSDQASLDPSRLVFLDETGASTNLSRTHGRCERGKRLVMDVPHGHGKTTTFVGALRHDGLVAPTVVDGAMTGEVFVADVQQQRVRVLRPGDIVVMDNLSSHHRPAVREAIETATAELRYLPAYSPDLNPIERAFRKRKAKLRAARKRTIPELEDDLGEAIDAFAPKECRNYFASCGYTAAIPNREPL
jgi:transposase